VEHLPLRGKVKQEVLNLKVKLERKEGKGNSVPIRVGRSGITPDVERVGNGLPQRNWVGQWNPGQIQIIQVETADHRDSG